MEKKELLEALVSLRAGLSVLACENDQIDALVKDLARQREEYETRCQSLRTTIREKETLWETSKMNFEKKKQVIRLECREKELKQNLNRKKGFFFSKKNQEEGPTPLEEAEALIAAEQSLLNNEKNEIDRMIQSAQKQQEEGEAALQAQIDVSNATIREMGAAGQAMRASLERVYSELLYRGDWAQLDWIIFYLESGRADTLKEALSLLDREKQTQRLEQAIGEATSRLQEALNASVQALRNTVEQGFSRMQQELRVGFSTQNQIILRTAKETDAQIQNSSRQIEKYMGRLCSTEALNHALLQKIHTNSATLVSGCDRLCSLTHATNEELRQLYYMASRPN